MCIRCNKKDQWCDGHVPLLFIVVIKSSNSIVSSYFVWCKCSFCIGTIMLPFVSALKSLFFSPTVVCCFSLIFFSHVHSCLLSFMVMVSVLFTDLLPFSWHCNRWWAPVFFTWEGGGIYAHAVLCLACWDDLRSWVLLAMHAWSILMSLSCPCLLSVSALALFS